MGLRIEWTKEDYQYGQIEGSWTNIIIMTYLHTQYFVKEWTNDEDGDGDVDV